MEGDGPLQTLSLGETIADFSVGFSLGLWSSSLLPLAGG